MIDRILDGFYILSLISQNNLDFILNVLRRIPRSSLRLLQPEQKKTALYTSLCKSNVLFCFNNILLNSSSSPHQVHNLAGFDSHLIVKALKIDKSRFSVLPRNAERIVTMSIGNFKFIDSSSFLPESLESLVRNLKDKDPSLFIQTKKLSGESLKI